MSSAQAQRAERPASSSSPIHQAPPDFDAGAMPILARHWFAVAPFRANGEVAAEAVADLRFRRQVIRLHEHGPRATAELLAELGAERSIMTLIGQKIDRYAELEPEALAAAGGDDFWVVPIREVRS